MDGLNTWLTIFLNHLNAGLALGVVLAVLILLRPLPSGSSPPSSGWQSGM